MVLNLRLYAAVTVYCNYSESHIYCVNCRLLQHSYCPSTSCNETENFKSNFVERNWTSYHSSALIEIYSNEVFGKITTLSLTLPTAIKIFERFLTNASELFCFDASRNYIKSLTKYSFEGAPLLQTIVLDHNHIESIDELTFNGLSKLKNLFLKGNLLSEIYPNTFDGLENLQVLDLTKNNLAVIPKKALENKNQLKTLNIDFITFYNIHQYLQQNIINVLRKDFIFKEFLDLKKYKNNIATDQNCIRYANSTNFSAIMATKKEIYNQVYNLMISFVVIILILFGCVGFLIRSIGNLNETTEEAKLENNFEPKYCNMTMDCMNKVQLECNIGMKKDPHYEDIEKHLKTTSEHEEEIYQEIM